MQKRVIESGLMCTPSPSLEPEKFKLVEGGDTRVYISERQSTSQMVYYFVIVARKGIHYGDEEEWPEHVLELQVISPTYLSKEDLRRAWNDTWGSSYPGEGPASDAEIVCALREHDVEYTVAELGGDDFDACFRRLGQEARAVSSLFGFYLDRRANRAGNTGWDMLKGTAGVWEKHRDEYDRADVRASAELVACFALSGAYEPATRYEDWFEDTDDELRHMASAYVTDWLIANPIRRGEDAQSNNEK